jgi:hypothetical protein
MKSASKENISIVPECVPPGIFVYVWKNIVVLSIYKFGNVHKPRKFWDTGYLTGKVYECETCFLLINSFCPKHFASR